MKYFFDLDGTLIDVAPRHYRVYNEVTTHFGGTLLDQKTYWDLKRSKAKWPDILAKSGLVSLDVGQYLQEFRGKIEDPAYLRQDTLFPGALEIVSATAKNGDCYLVSLRRNLANLKEELGWLGLSPHFSGVLSGHSENDGSDVKIELIRQALGNEKGLIVGDTEADILAGKELGLITVAVCSGLRERAFLEAMQPDYLITTVAELPAAL